MSLMCPIGGCKDKKGMCSHEKIMLGVVGVAILAALAIKLF